jgi:hypothetical protein
LKGSSAVTQEHANRIVAVVGKGEVGFAVCVEITAGYK